MTTERFYTIVEECLGGGCHFGVLAEEEAARTTHVVLETIGRTLDHDERLQLSSSLPRRLAVELMAGQGAPHADPIGWIACELQVDRDIAFRRVEMVLRALHEAVGEPHASLTP